MDSRKIAELAGVSRSTVSRVLNNHPSVKPETRKRIMEIIEREGYVPNSAARILVGKKSRIVGLFIIGEKNHLFRNSYFSPFTVRVIETAQGQDYDVIVKGIWSKDDEQDAYRLFSNGTIVGGIAVGAKRRDTLILDMLEHGIPLAVIDNEEFTEYEQVVSVNSDNALGATQAIEFLLSHGCRRIFHISGDEEKVAGSERRRMTEAILRKHPEVELRIESGVFLEQGGYNAMRTVLDSGWRPDGIFSAFDDMALGAWRACREAGVAVPQDVRIVGYGNGETGRLLGLTTINASIEDTAETAVKELLRMIEKGASSHKMRLIDTELVVRDT